ncbi:hypothetical protein H4219_004576 [Mycoemilia scoparia]|uniref:AA9 family lytic polysaccharide monooxygenase n=1 Tax=Mycoemilia scoparia TaxID=417184 RepID=A0A9W8A0R7_9FUNG|nr:hypothetical protein H4219_004576 [Mycoemilia scoparia]
MKLQTQIFCIVLLAALATLTAAHTHIRQVVLNGKQYEPAQCIRPYGKRYSYPVLNIDGPEMKCGYAGGEPGTTMTCPATALGSQMSLRWNSELDIKNQNVIAENHLGSCLVYMAPLASNGLGDVWFKIFEEGYNNKTKEWCNQKLRRERGYLNFTLPSNIPPGDYLVRGEIITLQSARERHSVNPKLGVQLYINCAQIRLSGEGRGESDAKKLLPPGVAFPGAYKDTDPGMLIDLKKSNPDDYQIPGPKIDTTIFGRPGGEGGGEKCPKKKRS